jgi:CubicO group peptidase (beta-lactamase class C family)
MSIHSVRLGRSLLAFVFASVLTFPATAANDASAAPAGDAIDRYVHDFMQRRHVTGLSLAVVRNGHVVKCTGYGLANAELSVPATADSVYQIASVTKTFTSTVIMMLVEEGAVALEDPISKHLCGLPEAWQRVTIRQLLSHTSGIPDFTQSPDGDRDRFAVPTSFDKIVAMTSAKPMQFQPGDRWGYSNTNYYVLGHLIEVKSAKPYADVMRERIFEPLDMTSTRVSDGRGLIPNRAAGYGWEADKGVHHNSLLPDMTWPFAAGAIASSVADMVKFDAALNTERLLKRSTLEQMWTAVKQNDGTPRRYGLGWGVWSMDGRRIVDHSGGIPGFGSYFGRQLDDHLSIIVLCNEETAGGEGIARKIVSICLSGENNASAPAASADTTDHTTAASSAR